MRPVLEVADIFRRHGEAFRAAQRSHLSRDQRRVMTAVEACRSRLIDCEGGTVRFHWKDYRAHDKHKVISLQADEFIRRFLLHVLPSGFRRIRYFGFLANTHRTAKLIQIRAALDTPEPPPKVPSVGYREIYATLTGRRLDVCPCCGGRMIEVGTLPRTPPVSRATPRCDSS